MDTNEPPLDMRNTLLYLQNCVKLVSNEVNPAYLDALKSDIVASKRKGYQTIRVKD